MAMMADVPPALVRLKPKNIHNRTSRNSARTSPKANWAPRLSSQPDHGMCSGGASLSASRWGLSLAPSGAVVIALRPGAATPPGRPGVASVGRDCDRDGIGSSAMKHHQFLTSGRTVPPSRPSETGSSYSCTRCAIEGVLYGGYREQEVVLLRSRRKAAIAPA